MKNEKIVFFYEDPSILTFARKHLHTSHFYPICLKLQDLPTYSISNDYLKSCIQQNNVTLQALSKGNEKGLIHYRRDYKQSGPENFRRIFTVWSSKVFLVNQIVDLNPYQTSKFAWVDASYARFLRPKKPNKWNLDFYRHDFTPSFIYHYSSNMKYYGKSIQIHAAFMIGGEPEWKKLLDLYKEQLEISKTSNYAHDEETLLHLVSERGPTLFHKIDRTK